MREKSQNRNLQVVCIAVIALFLLPYPLYMLGRTVFFEALVLTRERDYLEEIESDYPDDPKKLSPAMIEERIEIMTRNLDLFWEVDVLRLYRGNEARHLFLIGAHYLLLERPREALVPLKKALAIQEEKLGESHERTAATRRELEKARAMLSAVDDSS